MPGTNWRRNSGRDSYSRAGIWVVLSATDLLFEGTAVAEFSAPFVQGVSTHGTGCTYSAAIAARLALGDSLQEAIARAKEFVSRAIRDHFSWTNSSGEVHALNHER